MSILIKGMEMPKDKEIFLRIDEKGEVYVYGSYPTELHKAVPVQPHGRLIDANELIEFIENRYEITWENSYEGGIKDACVDILEKMSTMPTVIQASEEG